MDKPEVYRSVFEKENWFEKITKKHIELVKKYGNIIASQIDADYSNKLRKNLLSHDASKFVEPEKAPYILIAWNYHCKDIGKNFVLTQKQKDQMNEATTHHVKNNEHHPEFWSPRENVIPKNDRDKFDPDSVPTIEVNNMPFIAICEMVADWCARSEERGNTPREWADKVLGKRWLFPEEQTKQIYDLIDVAWN